jgi:hypothetical protein
MASLRPKYRASSNISEIISEFSDILGHVNVARIHFVTSSFFARRMLSWGFSRLRRNAKQEAILRMSDY